MIESRLIEVASSLCQRTGRRPREAFMRRAVSTAYYATFHALCRMCADELVGGKHAGTKAWQRIYRGVGHTAAKDIFKTPQRIPLTPLQVSFGKLFIELQELRHKADYDPTFFPYFFAETELVVETSRAAIQKLSALNADERKLLAAVVLIKARQS